MSLWSVAFLFYFLIAVGVEGVVQGHFGSVTFLLALRGKQ